MSTAVDIAEKLEDRTKPLLDLVKDGFTILRDLSLLVLFIALLFFPARLNHVLTSAGITRVNGGIFEWQQKVQDSAEKNAAAWQETSASLLSFQDTKANLLKLASTTRDPQTKQALLETAGKMDGSLTRLDKANSTITQSYLAQKQVLATAAAATGAPPSPSSIAAGAQGWIYAGKEDKTHTRWITPPQPKIDAPSPQIRPGETVTLTDDLFVRNDRLPGQIFNQASIQGAIRKGSRVQVLQLQPSPGLNGGDFVWLKVQVIDPR